MNQTQNQTTIKLNDFELNQINEGLVAISKYNSIFSTKGKKIVSLFNKIETIIKANEQMDIDLEYNYNLHKELPPITQEEIDNLPPPPKELLDKPKIKQKTKKLDIVLDSWKESELNKKKVKFNELKGNAVVKLDGDDNLYLLTKFTPKMIEFRQVRYDIILDIPKTAFTDGHRYLRVKQNVYDNVEKPVRKKKSNAYCTVYDNSNAIIKYINHAAH
jgi:hypothetical protein